MTRRDPKPTITTEGPHVGHPARPCPFAAAPSSSTTEGQAGEGRKIEPSGSAGRATPWFAERFVGILQTSSRTGVGR